MDDCVIMLSSDSSAPNSPERDEQKCSTNEDTSFNSDNIVTYPQTNYELQTRFNHENFATNIAKSNVISASSVELLSEDNHESGAESDILADLPPVNFLEKAVDENKIKRKKISKSHELSDSDDSSEFSQKYDSCHIEGKSDHMKQATHFTENVLKKSREKGRGKNTASNEERERKKAERLEKQIQKARDKALKQVTNEALRSKKPDKCLKYIKVCLDHNLMSAEFGGQILVELQTAGLQYNIQTNSLSNSIMWTRETLEHSMGEDLKVTVESRVTDEDEVILVWMWDRVVELVKNGCFLTQVQITQTEMPGKTITFIIYGSEEYFKYQKKSKKRKVRANVFGVESRPKANKKETNLESMPQISEEDWELAITEVQLFGFQHVMLDSADDVGIYVRQFTKAVAEAPYKREKQEQNLGDVDWYAEGDSRNCVRVDKNGNGLLRLWQQQLCQFNNAGLDSSKAIAAVYGSPTALVKAYENCSTETEAQLLLASIPVRRGIGPLTSIRSVGPELSKKIYAFFTSFDGKPDSQDE